MKNLLLSLFSLFITTQLFADIPPDKDKFTGIQLCTIIENAEAYSAKALVLGPGGKFIKEYAIKNNECLNRGYKFNQFNIQINKKNIESKYEDLGKTVDYVDKDYPYSSEKRIYRIEDNKVVYVAKTSYVKNQVFIYASANE